MLSDTHTHHRLTPNPQHPQWRGDLLAFICGAVVVFSLAPFNLWLFGILACGLLAQCLKGLSAKRAWLRSFLFGMGMYGSGISWVYISIHDFGYTSPLLAVIMTTAFVTFIASLFSIPFYFYQRFFAHNRTGFLLGFPAIWVLGEWIRSWLLTGFPWLYLGYAHIDTWLAGWAPVLGVYGLSFIAAFSGVVIIALLQELGQRVRRNKSNAPTLTRALWYALSAATLLWCSGLALHQVEWTQHSEEDRLSVSIVQPNIPLQLKWNPLYRPTIMSQLRDLSEDHWHSDILVWPEASIPLMYHDASDFIEEMEQRAAEHNTALISGILYDDLEQEKYYNAIMGMGAADNIYFKQRLVPFGEYVPLEKYLRGLIAFFDLPNSIIHAGPSQQEGLRTQRYTIAPYICYEVVYPDLVAKNLGDAQLLVTISNDAWFGESIGPLQHFQMAQMRALENSRFLIRGTNTGLSGIVSHKGEVLFTSEQFEAQTLSGYVYLTHGFTPFSRTGSVPIIVICLLIIALSRRRSSLE